MSSNDSVLSGSDHWGKALHACSTCRKQKKGCDKALPSCSVCRRLQRVCVYDPIPSASGPDNLESLARRVADLENELREHRELCEARAGSEPSRSPDPGSGGRNEAAFLAATPFPNAFFLDVNVFKRRRLKAPKPQMIINDIIFREIGNDLDVRATVGAYFFCTATWMSVVSRQLYQEVSGLHIEMAPDVVLLILCMKLANDRLGLDVQDPRTKLYAIAKNFFLTVESSGFASIRLLQAGILLCLYETGHAIYPQAYISIGHIGRLGQAIGLHNTDGVPQLALVPGSWDEMEERRRVWWAVYNLDRHMNIGNPSRSLALAETGRKEYLPVDDKVWEEGEIIVSEPLFVSSPTSIAGGPFTRLCQASHLLSLVLTHVNDDIFESNNRLEEAQQLNGALLALCSFMQHDISSEATKISVPMATCYRQSVLPWLVFAATDFNSALIILYEHSSAGQTEYSQNPDHDLYQFGSTGLHALVSKLGAYASHVQSILPYNLDQASPLIANCFYRIAVWLSGLSGDMVKPHYSTTLTLMNETLSKLALRWKVAGEYLKILEDFELTSAADEAMILDHHLNAEAV